MGKKLYVGNLALNVTEDQLQALFTPCGQVTSAKLIADKYNGRSRGFGFVEMVDDAGAESAIKKLNGFTVEGKPIVVNEARPKEEHGPGGRPSAGRRPPGGRGGGNRGGEGGAGRW